jgi:hypothetical protein
MKKPKERWRVVEVYTSGLVFTIPCDSLEEAKLLKPWRNITRKSVRVEHWNGTEWEEVEG